MRPLSLRPCLRLSGGMQESVEETTSTLSFFALPVLFDAKRAPGSSSTVMQIQFRLLILTAPYAAWVIERPGGVRHITWQPTMLARVMDNDGSVQYIFDMPPHSSAAAS